MKKQIFIVRFWSECHEDARAHPELRGTIQHIASGRKYPLTQFNSIIDCIGSYLPDGKRPLPLTAQTAVTTANTRR